MPRLPLGITTLIAACDALIEAARLHWPVFTAHGLPADYLTEFRQALDSLLRTRDDRARHVDMHVSARAGMRVQLVRGRLAVDRLDALVRAGYRGDEAVLTAWRVGKRVHRGGGRGVRAPDPIVDLAA